MFFGKMRRRRASKKYWAEQMIRLEAHKQGWDDALSWKKSEEDRKKMVEEILKGRV